MRMRMRGDWPAGEKEKILRLYGNVDAGEEFCIWFRVMVNNIVSLRIFTSNSSRKYLNYRQSFRFLIRLCSMKFSKLQTLLLERYRASFWFSVAYFYILLLFIKT